jgi:hypothetical protein
MRGDRIEREMRGFAEWEENLPKNKGDGEVFTSTGHSI